MASTPLSASSRLSGPDRDTASALVGARIAAVVIIALVAVVISATSGAKRSASAQSSAGSNVATAVGISPGAAINLMSSAQVRAEFDRIDAVGVSWIRLDINWAQVESNEGSFNWDVPDATVLSARDRGIEVLGLLSYAPSWAIDVNVPVGDAPVDPAAFAQFAAAAAQRYGPHGVSHWEIWNEPNLDTFWPRDPNSSEYGHLLAAAGNAIHAVQSEATVITGGLAPAADEPGSIAPLTFVQGLYGATPQPASVQDSFDGVGIHPYSYPEQPTFDAAWNPFRVGMPAIYAVMTEYGDGAKQVWPTEYGAPTGTHSRSVSESSQRDMIVEAITCTAAQSWIGPLFLYNLSDPASGSASNLEDNFGLYRANASTKLAWSATRSKVSEAISTQTCSVMDQATCDGLAVTVHISRNQVPTAADDVILGTAGDDDIHGLGGDDTICGLAGDDLIDGGGGNDVIFGDSGRDRLRGGPGADRLFGGDGVDHLNGHAGNDTLVGDGGSDHLRGGDNRDTIHGGSGADRIYGQDGPDEIFGMGGQDRIWGGAGDDTVQGNHQSDDIHGGPGNDVLRGAGGKDEIFGEAGADALFGGNNSDTLSGGGQVDALDGQAGRDSCSGGGQLGDTTTRC